MAEVTISTFKHEVSELRDRRPGLTPDNLFVLWFLRAYATDSEDMAAAALTGGTGDKALDAVLIDDAHKAVFVVQGKYRASLGKKNESRADVVDFVRLSALLDGDKEDFDSYCADMEPSAKEALSNARERLLKRSGYRLNLLFVTLGKCSPAIEREAKRIANRVDRIETQFEVIDSRRLVVVMRDWLQGVAPSVPALSLPIEGDDVLKREDPRAGITSWVFSVAGNNVASLFDRAQDRIFARNIRGYKGNTKINRSIEQTISSNPENFWYFNNGVTIVCDEALRIGDSLEVTNPQIINGQQTTRTLHDSGAQSRKASVLIKVMEIPRDTDELDSRFETIVSRVVAATNWQNPIKQTDLRSNDAKQIALELQLRAYGYQYLRKGQTKGEANRIYGRAVPKIKKEDLAIAIAGCKFPSLPRLAGKQPLFGEHYEEIFEDHEVIYYLSCYWLWKTVESVARGARINQGSKFVVLYFLWKDLGSEIRAHSLKFVRALEREEPDVMKPLRDAAGSVFRAAGESFSANRGKGADRLESSTYFKRLRAHSDFDAYWSSRRNRHRTIYRKRAEGFKNGLRALVV